jgi:uncharacterized protein HemX
MNRPPDEPTPTRATRPIGSPVEREVVPAEREVVLDPLLAEKIDSASFWSKVGSAIAVLAAIIGVIALIVALGNNDTSNNGSTAGLRQQVNQLQDDVSQLKQDVSSRAASSNQVERLSSRISKLEGQLTQVSDDQQQATQDISKLQQNLTDLSDRVDQVEKAQEQAASGGP